MSNSLPPCTDAAGNQKDVNGCYIDNWKNMVVVEQKGSTLSIRYKGEVLEGILEGTDVVSVQSLFWTRGEVQNAGDVKFRDGGFWKKQFPCGGKGCHDLSGEYTDNHNNRVKVVQIGHCLNVDYAGKVKQGFVCGCESRCTGNVHVETFEESGVVDGAGNVSFADGGRWEKLPTQEGFEDKKLSDDLQKHEVEDDQKAENTKETTGINVESEIKFADDTCTPVPQSSPTDDVSTSVSESSPTSPQAVENCKVEGNHQLQASTNSDTDVKQTPSSGSPESVLADSKEKLDFKDMLKTAAEAGQSGSLQPNKKPPWQNQQTPALKKPVWQTQETPALKKPAWQTQATPALKKPAWQTQATPVKKSQTEEKNTATPVEQSQLGDYNLKDNECVFFGSGGTLVAKEVNLPKQQKRFTPSTPAKAIWGQRASVDKPAENAGLTPAEIFRQKQELKKKANEAQGGGKTEEPTAIIENEVSTKPLNFVQCETNEKNVSLSLPEDNECIFFGAKGIVIAKGG